MPVLWKGLSASSTKAGTKREHKLLVDRLHELPNNQGHALDPFYLLLRSYKLSLETSLLILDIFLLQTYVSAPGKTAYQLPHSHRSSHLQTRPDLLEMPLELLELCVVVVFALKAIYIQGGGVGGISEGQSGGAFCDSRVSHGFGWVQLWASDGGMKVMLELMAVTMER
jgi:hypothetical protein